jgi:hypothetical protein
MGLLEVDRCWTRIAGLGREAVVTAFSIPPLRMEANIAASVMVTGSCSTKFVKRIDCVLCCADLFCELIFLGSEYIIERDFLTCCHDQGLRFSSSIPDSRDRLSYINPMVSSVITEDEK